MHGERKKINENEFHFPHFTLASHSVCVGRVGSDG